MNKIALVAMTLGTSLALGACSNNKSASDDSSLKARSESVVKSSKAKSRSVSSSKLASSKAASESIASSKAASESASKAASESKASSEAAASSSASVSRAIESSSIAAASSSILASQQTATSSAPQTSSQQAPAGDENTLAGFVKKYGMSPAAYKMTQQGMSAKDALLSTPDDMETSGEIQTEWAYK